MDKLKKATFEYALNAVVSRGLISKIKWNKISNRYLRYFLKAIVAIPCFPIAFARDSCYLRTVTKSIFTKKRIAWFPYFEIVITTRCSLRCKYCANLLQYYEKPYDVNLQILKISIDRLMQCCDYVSMVGLIGGEPFLCKNLTEVLETVMSYPQIDQILLLTNGTIPIQDAHLLELLRKGRVQLKISDYGFGHAEELCQILRENGVPYSHNKGQDWMDYGNLKCRNRSSEELKRQLKKCSPKCVSFLNGKLYHCPRSSHGTDLGMIPSRSNEWLDFTDESNPVTSEQLLKFYYYDFCGKDSMLTACNYCDMGMKGKPRPIPAGQEQLSTPLRE